MKKTSFYGIAIALLLATAFTHRTNAQELICPTLKAGDLFKVPNNPAVYYINDDLKRLYFPHSEIFYSWYKDYSSIIEIAPQCADNYPAPNLPPYGVNYRPGSRLVKVQISPSVYVIEPGNKLRRIKDETVARDLYGPNWANLVRDVSDGFWPNYKVQLDGLNESKPHDGMFVKTPNSSDVYYVEDGELEKVELDPKQDVRTIGVGVFSKLAVRSGLIDAKKAFERPDQHDQDEITRPNELPKPVSPQVTPSANTITVGALTLTVLDNFLTSSENTRIYWTANQLTNCSLYYTPSEKKYAAPFLQHKGVVPDAGKYYYYADIDDMKTDINYSYRISCTDVESDPEGRSKEVPKEASITKTLLRLREHLEKKATTNLVDLLVEENSISVVSSTSQFNEAPLFWSTNQAAVCAVEYSKNPDLTDKKEVTSWFIKDVTVANDTKFHYSSSLNKLDDSDYYYRVNCKAENKPIVSSEIKKLSKPNSEITKTPLTISNIHGDVYTNSITLEWNTNKASDSWIAFYEFTFVAKNITFIRSSAVTTNHKITINNLKENSTYNYILISQNGSQIQTSELLEFTTEDVSAPKISDYDYTVSTTANTATIRFTSDEAITGTATFKNLSTTQPELITDIKLISDNWLLLGPRYEAKIAGLTSGTKYSYVLKLKDKSGNSTEKTGTFQTLSQINLNPKIRTLDSKIQSDNSLTLSWYVDRKVTCQIKLSENSKLDGLIMQVGQFERTLTSPIDNIYKEKYNVKFYDLKTNSDYHYQILCFADDNSYSNSDIKMIPKYSVIDLKINKEKTMVNNDKAVIYWDTNVESECTVLYNPTTTYNETTSVKTINGIRIDSNLTASDGRYRYMTNLSNLNWNTDYSYAVDCYGLNSTVKKGPYKIPRNTITPSTNTSAAETVAGVIINNNFINYDGNADLYWSADAKADCGGIVFAKTIDMTNGSSVSANVVRKENDRTYYTTKLYDLGVEKDSYYKINCLTSDNKFVQSGVQTLHKYTTAYTPVDIKIEPAYINVDNSANIVWSTDTNTSCNIMYGETSNFINKAISSNRIYPDKSFVDRRFYYSTKLSYLENQDHYFFIICTAGTGSIQSPIHTLNRYDPYFSPSY